MGKSEVFRTNSVMNLSLPICPVVSPGLPSRLELNFNQSLHASYRSYLLKHGGICHAFQGKTYAASGPLPCSPLVAPLELYGFNEPSYEDCALFKANRDNGDILPLGFLIIGLADADRYILIEAETGKIFLMPFSDRGGMEYAYGSYFLTDSLEAFLGDAHAAHRKKPYGASLFFAAVQKASESIETFIFRLLKHFFK